MMVVFHRINLQESADQPALKMLVLHLLFIAHPPSPILCQNESMSQWPRRDNGSYKERWKGSVQNGVCFLVAPGLF
jgi:hypothetical protein